MSIAAVSSVKARDLQCGFARTRLAVPRKAESRIGYVGCFSRSLKGTVQGIQASDIRTYFMSHSQSREARRCFASRNGLEAFRADFSTSNKSDPTAGEENDTFLERLRRAWSVLFPEKSKPSSNREIAKQRLKMILVSDRCSVNDEAKKKIVTNIVGALSDFVEIQSEEKVLFNVTSDAELNTVCSVTVPVRRVRPQYQEFSSELVNSELGSFDYEEEEGSFRMVDIRFERPGVEDIQD